MVNEMLLLILWSFVVAFVCANVALIVGVSFYMHRFLSHRSIYIKSDRLILFCRFVVWIATYMDPLEWARVHIKHHIYADSDKDPYSPNSLGSSVLKILFLNGKVYNKAKKEPDILDETYVRPWHPKPDKWDRIFGHVNLGIVAMWLVYATFFSYVNFWRFGVDARILLAAFPASLAMVFHIAIILLGGGAVNALNHDPVGLRLQAIWRTSEVRSKTSGYTWNRVWLALYTAGEGWHNNHHLYPGNYRFGPYFEITARFAEMLAWIGRVFNVELVELCMERPLDDIMRELKVQKERHALMSRSQLELQRDRMRPPRRPVVA